eukprot:s7_g93.t1
METERQWAIKRVVAVETPHSKKDWFPHCRDVEGHTFFRFLKFDRGVVIALTGKGLELRAAKNPHLLDGKEYDRIVHLRNTECNRRYQETMRLAAEAIGEEWQPTKNSMMAKDDHRLIVAQYVTITLPAKCLWGTKAADLWLELKTDVLHYLAIAMKMPAAADASEPSAATPAGEQGDSLPASEAAAETGGKVPKSPKRKRRRFQPKRSPKKKAKTKPDPTVEEECNADDENKESESDLEG